MVAQVKRRASPPIGAPPPPLPPPLLVPLLPPLELADGHDGGSGGGHRALSLGRATGCRRKGLVLALSPSPPTAAAKAACSVATRWARGAGAKSGLRRGVRAELVRVPLRVV